MYNLPGLGQRLKLNGPVLANIYLGNITTWNAAAIRALNPGASLPDTKITVVYRSDGSGSTYAFTNYLATVSPQWKSKVGVNTTVNFPTGTGARGSAGVAGVVKSTEGALTYADAAYAITNKISFALMEPIGGELAYLHEVDAARWVTLDEARRLLTYERDVALLDRVTEAA